MSQKVEKVHKKSLEDVLDVFEFVKNRKFDDPPSNLIWEKIEIGKFFNFGYTLGTKKYNPKTLKLA